MNQTLATHITIIMPLIIQLIGLTFVLLVDSYISKKNKRLMFGITALLVLLVFQNVFENMLTGGNPAAPPEIIPMRTATAVLGYCVRPMVLILFCYIVEPSRKYRIAWTIIGVNAAVHFSAFFSHVCFWIDENNHYQGGPLNDFCLIVSMALFAYLVYLTLLNFSGAAKKRIFFIPIFNIILIIASLVLDSSVGRIEQLVSFLTIALIASCLFYYIWLHLQFVKEHERDLMASQRIQIMMSQIKPHFLYNSLGAIEELCESNPKAAKEATVKFSRYLRCNMDSIETDGLISFEKELSHVRLYLELEQIRFEDALEVRYDISCNNFKVPALSVEPLAENAVLHGVRENDDGRGCVTIATREFPDRFEISVTDNGPGFDPDNISDDGRDHIGIKNVRERLRRMCGGELLIESSPGHGTKAKIIIPKEGAE